MNEIAIRKGEFHMGDKPVVWVAGGGFGNEELAGLFEAVGRKAVLLDMGLDKSVFAEVTHKAATHGVPGLLVNNFFTPLEDAPLHGYTEAVLDLAYLQLDAYSYLTKRAIPHFINGGVIVNIIPALGLIPAKGQSLISALSSGVIAMTRSWALELAYINIRSFAIAVGFTTEKNAPLSYPAIKRAVAPKDIFELIVYGEKSEMLDGSCVPLEGGYVAGYARDF